MKNSGNGVPCIMISICLWPNRSVEIELLIKDTDTYLCLIFTVGTISKGPVCGVCTIPFFFADTFWSVFPRDSSHERIVYVLGH